MKTGRLLLQIPLKFRFLFKIESQDDFIFKFYLDVVAERCVVDVCVFDFDRLQVELGPAYHLTR